MRDGESTYRIKIGMTWRGSERCCWPRLLANEVGLSLFGGKYGDHRRSATSSESLVRVWANDDGGEKRVVMMGNIAFLFFDRKPTFA